MQLAEYTGLEYTGLAGVGMHAARVPIYYIYLRVGGGGDKLDPIVRVIVHTLDLSMILKEVLDSGHFIVALSLF
jgi:hypothetical protein